MSDLAICEQCRERPVKARGLCQRCYDRARSPRIRPARPACERCGDRPRHRKGLCKRCDRLENPERARAADRRSNARRARTRPPRMPGEPSFPVTTRTCAGCGRELEGRGRAKWCSDRCRKRTLYAGVCVDCGAPTSGCNGPGKAPKRCQPCDARLVGDRARAAARPRRELVERLWAEGKSPSEIAEVMDWSSYPSIHIATLRGRGYDLPYRPRPLRAEDLSGQRFGRWLVLERAVNDRRGRSRWVCRCDCGTERAVPGRRLRSGESSSCGCRTGNQWKGRTTTGVELAA
jgi:hypothetical protein